MGWAADVCTPNIDKDFSENSWRIHGNFCITAGSLEIHLAILLLNLQMLLKDNFWIKQHRWYMGMVIFSNFFHPCSSTTRNEQAQKPGRGVLTSTVHNVTINATMCLESLKKLQFNGMRRWGGSFRMILTIASQYNYVKKLQGDYSTKYYVVCRYYYRLKMACKVS